MSHTINVSFLCLALPFLAFSLGGGGELFSHLFRGANTGIPLPIHFRQFNTCFQLNLYYNGEEKFPINVTLH